MNALEAARKLDEADIPIASAWAYEIAIAQGAALAGDAINLAFIYFNACDFGFASAHHLPVEFIQVAGSRWPEVLRSASSQRGEEIEPVFWIEYFNRFLELDSTADRRLDALLRDHPTQLLCGLWGFVFRERAEFRPQARALWDDVQTGADSKSRYIRGVLARPLEAPLPAPKDPAD